MTFRIFSLLASALLLSLTAGFSSAQTGRTQPAFATWSADCGNTGLCSASSFTRSAAVWVDMRIIRDWHADALPLIRLTTNNELAKDGTLRFEVDGKPVDAFPIAQLREIQASVVVPSGFRPLGGEGYWYPTGPAAKALLDAIMAGKSLTIQLPATPDPVTIAVPLAGLKEALAWLDDHQNRTGTVAAIASTGSEPAADAPHAVPVVSPEELPGAVAAIWAANRLCSEIDPAIFSGLHAVRAQMPDKSALYLLPCGAPTADNAAYVAILEAGDGAARQIQFARMADRGPVATDLIYNARWTPSANELTSYFKGSVLGECGLWNRWNWTPSGFVLIEGAARKTCDGTEPNLAAWSTTWPPEDPPR